MDGLSGLGSGIYTNTGNGFSDGMGSGMDYNGKRFVGGASTPNTALGPRPSWWERAASWLTDRFRGRGAGITTTLPGATVSRVGTVEVGPVEPATPYDPMQDPKYDAAYVRRFDGPIQYVGGANDVTGFFEVAGIALAASDSKAMNYAALPFLLMTKHGDDALKILAAEKGFIISTGKTKKGQLKADYLFENSNDAKNFGASVLGTDKKRIYNKTGKWIGWENKSGDQVYWGHGDWGNGKGSSTFPHLNYSIRGQQGHFFLNNKIQSKGFENEFKQYFNLGK